MKEKKRKNNIEKKRFELAPLVKSNNQQQHQWPILLYMYISGYICVRTDKDSCVTKMIWEKEEI